MQGRRCISESLRSFAGMSSRCSLIACRRLWSRRFGCGDASSKIIQHKERRCDNGYMIFRIHEFLRAEATVLLKWLVPNGPWTCAKELTRLSCMRFYDRNIVKQFQSRDEKITRSTVRSKAKRKMNHVRSYESLRRCNTRHAVKSCFPSIMMPKLPG